MIEGGVSVRYEWSVPQLSNRHLVMVMKLTKQLAAIGAATLIVAASVPAQTNPVNTTGQPLPNGRVILPEKLTAPDSANATISTLRPALTERPNLPPEVLARIERFKQDARAYLARQEALKKQLQGANDKERALIREQLKELRDRWLERARELRKEYKERQAELADKLSEYRELLNDVRASAPSQAAQGGRTRRGDD